MLDNHLAQNAVSSSKSFSHLLEIHLKHVEDSLSLPKPETNVYVAKLLCVDKKVVFSS